MDIAKAAQAGDITLEKDGLKLFLEERANQMLVSTTIDFNDNQGFVLSGMQQKGSSCGSCSTC
jgi:Fe-S cluster assembly iron-binding protein IscA